MIFSYLSGFAHLDLTLDAGPSENPRGEQNGAARAGPTSCVGF
jgi:hypothetical protein